MEAFEAPTEPPLFYCKVGPRQVDINIGSALRPKNCLLWDPSHSLYECNMLMISWGSSLVEIGNLTGPTSICQKVVYSSDSQRILQHFATQIKICRVNNFLTLLRPPGMTIAQSSPA